MQPLEQDGVLLRRPLATLLHYTPHKFLNMMFYIDAALLTFQELYDFLPSVSLFLFFMCHTPEQSNKTSSDGTEICSFFWGDEPKSKLITAGSC